jgi:hypothetical protein
MDTKDERGGIELVTLGLDYAELETLLADVQDEKTRAAIAKAISANNEAIAKQVLSLVSSDLMNVFKAMGVKA